MYKPKTFKKNSLKQQWYNKTISKKKLQKFTVVDLQYVITHWQTVGKLVLIDQSSVRFAKVR